MSKSDRNLEAISAYLDGELTGNDRERIERLLQEDASLQNWYEELRRTRSLLRSTPTLRAPRNFVLTPEMVGQKAGPNRAFPILRFASAFAALLLVLLFLGDLFVIPRPVMAPARSVVVAESVELEEEAAVMEAEVFPSQAPGPPAEMLMQEAPVEGESAPQAAEDENISSSMDSVQTMEKSVPTQLPGTFGETGEMLDGAAEDMVGAGIEIEPETSNDLQDDKVERSLDYRYIVRVTEYALLVITLMTGIAAFYFFRRKSSP
jgi:hypothetical protein